MSVNFHGKEYKTVAERLIEIHQAFDQLDITTEVLAHEPVVIRATVKTGKGTFTGISYANVSKSIEKVSPYEVAETSAVGRALAFAGYAGSEIASAEEMIKAGVQPERATTPTREIKLITEKQLVLLNTLITNKGADRDEIKGFYKVASLKDLTLMQAKQAIDHLAKRANEGALAEESIQ